MAHGKSYLDARNRLEPDHAYTPLEAVRQIKSQELVRFDPTVELHIRLGVNVRHADQQLRGTISLPNGTGADVTVAVFAEGDPAREAEEAGADHVGGADLAARVQEGFTDFDVAIATPDMMPTVGKLGRVLGPRGLMPNPKAGTVTPDVAQAVEDFKGGKVEFRTDRNGNVHVPIGRASFDAEKISANLAVVVEELERAKPASAKGRYFKKVGLASTMGPGVKIDPARVETQVD